MPEPVKINEVVGSGIPLHGDDIDTDRILPARYLKEVTFERMGSYLFYDERFDSDGKKKSHPLNDEKFKGASILVVNKNFGCGSSREHAAQAIKRFGIKAVIGESFSTIFSTNCIMLGIPTIQLPPAEIKQLMQTIEGNPNSEIKIYLEGKKLKYQDKEIGFSISDSALKSLISGMWDNTMIMMSNMGAIKEVAGKLPYLNHFKQ